MTQRYEFSDQHESQEEELREVKEALQTVESKYKTLMEQLPVGVYRTAPEGKILQGNPTLARILGYRLEDLSSLKASEVFDDPSERERQLSEWRECGGVVANELLFCRGDGNKIWIRDTGRAIVDDNGDVVSFDGVIEDITERRRAEEALKEQTERLNTLLRSIGDGVVSLDLEFNLEVLNPKAEAYLTVLNSEEWTRHQKLLDIGGCPVEKLIDAPSSGNPYHEITIHEPDKRVFEVSAHAMTSNGLQKGWVLLIRDTTREREVRERMESRERLATMGQLAAGAAHDFNNVLLAMMSNAEFMLRSRDLPPEFKERLELIQNTGKQAALVIRQIMDYSIQSSGRRRSWLDMAQICRSVTDLLRCSLPDAIETSLSIEPGKYNIYAGLSGFQQMLTNLVLNSRDAMPGGGSLELRLSTRRYGAVEHVPHKRMADREWIVLEVSDTGEGMAPDVAPKIFEPFFTTKSAKMGTGLGLTQVYGIVKLHGGYVDVETAPGEGTTFTVYLPM